MSKIAYIIDNKEKFRFKTEQEFKENYGPEWRRVLPSTWPLCMDHMLGQELNKYYSYCVEMTTFWIKDTTSKEDTWRIAEEMLIEKGVFRTVDMSLRGTPGINTTKLTDYRDYSSILKL